MVLFIPPFKCLIWKNSHLKHLMYYADFTGNLKCAQFYILLCTTEKICNAVFLINEAKGIMEYEVRRNYSINVGVIYLAV